MVLPTIVIGADFSEGSKKAIRTVAALARGRPARMRLVHVSPLAKPRLSGAPGRRMKEAFAAAAHREALQLSRLGDWLRAKGFTVETVAVPGKPTETLLAQAKRSKAGLIAVGTAGKGGVKGFFLGSVAQSVLRSSPVPVLVTPVRQRKGPRQSGPVLAAVDLDDTAPAVVEAAAALARDLGVKVHVTHSMPIPFIGPDFSSTGVAFDPRVFAEDEAEAARRLTALAEPVRRDVEARASVGIGDPVTALLYRAGEIGASAIVVGRRKAGRRLGSVSAALVQAADRPVVVVPSGFTARGGTIGFGPAGGRLGD